MFDEITIRTTGRTLQSIRSRDIKAENQPLRDFIYSFESKRERTEIRKKIIDACLINWRTIDNWLLGTCKVPALAQEKINELFNQKIF